MLAWIQDRIDALVGLGPAAIVIVLGLVIVAIPLATMAVFLLQRARRGRRPAD